MNAERAGWRAHLKRRSRVFKENQKRLITTDKEIIEKIVEWLRLNIKAPYLETDLITDNKNLLKAIKDWKNEKIK